MLRTKIKINQQLFQETSHSPALHDIVGECDLKQIIDFCFIVNPYYPTDAMIRKLTDQFPLAIKAYPSSNPRLAQDDLARALRVDPEHLVIGNGSTELITLLERELIDDLAVPVPTFSEYLEKLRHPGSAKLFWLPEKEGYRLDLQDFASWITGQGISSALIINPGNPTGQLIPRDHLLSFLQRMEKLKLILMDESFIDFSGIKDQGLMPFIRDYPNLMIVRSMSKHYGVPGLRLGYCCSSNTEYLQRLRESLPVWNMNTMAEIFLSLLKETEKEYWESVRKIVADVEHLYSGLLKIPGYRVYPTGSNFILIKITCGLTAREAQQLLLENFGLYVRDCSNKTGLDAFHIRVASQGRKNDEALINALKELLLLVNNRR